MYNVETLNLSINEHFVGNDESEEIVLPKESTSQKKSENTKSGTTPTDETSLKNLEREIALQQLQDLPYLSPTNRFVRGKICKVSFCYVV